MMQYDIFNGDADGICALLQLRLAVPRPSAQLITGVKRDINLLQQVSAKAGDQLTVLDISLDKNREGLNQALAAEAEVAYFDHHFAGDIPEHANLEAHINPASDVCTSMLVNAHLNDEHILWAVVGAFGDNLNHSAEALASRTELNSQELQQLKQLGILINYNGYGASLDDLHFEPAQLYQILKQYPNPLDFCTADNEQFMKLSEGYEGDFSLAEATKAHLESEHVRIFCLPNQGWARRVSGVLGNQLANELSDKAHAVVTEKADGNYLVSIRAPLSQKSGADEFCRRYPSGGGRAAAAGINDLEADSLEQFCTDFSNYYRERLS